MPDSPQSASTHLSHNSRRCAILDRRRKAQAPPGLSGGLDHPEIYFDDIFESHPVKQLGSLGKGSRLRKALQGVLSGLIGVCLRQSNAKRELRLLFGGLNSCEETCNEIGSHLL
ncbi:hypothetical protein ACDY97_29075 [Rhizobium mongolense]|uniref:hypothetical protein n=1 Tax=Rhizobium mongolense TaxID=57676 RepID=UPI00355847E5